MDDRLDVAARVVMRWDPSAPLSDGGGRQEGMLFDGGGDHAEAERFLRAVDDLIIQRRLAPPSSASSAWDSAVQVAMARLEDEFRHVLSSRALDCEVAGLRSVSISSDDAWDHDDGSLNVFRWRSCYGGPQRSSHHESSTDLFPADAISDLHAIASRMAAAGYGSECVQAYASVRTPAVESALRRLGLENIDDDVRWLEWDALEAKTRRWTRAAHAAVSGVFGGERRLCLLVFHDLPHDAAAFADAVRGAAVQLLGFAEAVSVGRCSPEKLFRIIDVHDALAGLLPNIYDIFATSRATESVYVQAAKARSSLADAVRWILSEFESAVLRDASKTPVPGGTVHPLTRYVMNYNNLMCGYKASLSQLVNTSRRIIDLPDPGSQLPFAAHIVSIIVALESNLESKASLYKDDAALSHLFLMNNVRYIVHKVRDSSELRGLIGDAYLKRLTCKFRRAATTYKRSGWFKILNYLRDEGLRVNTGFSSGISELVLRERFKGFNAVFGEAHKVQSGWYVPDIRLREELRISISEKLLLAYRPFLGRYRHHVEKRSRSKSYIKYSSAEDLGTAMADFFEGASPSAKVLSGKGTRGTKYMGFSTKLTKS